MLSSEKCQLSVKCHGDGKLAGLHVVLEVVPLDVVREIADVDAAVLLRVAWAIVGRHHGLV